MPEENESPPARNGAPAYERDYPQTRKPVKSWFRALLRGQKPDNSLRGAIEEFIEEPQDEEADIVSGQERELISNILKLRDVSVVHVMIPRADIAAIEESISHEDLLALLAEKQFSRLPVYRGTLDEVLGTIHIKDVLAVLAKGGNIRLQDFVTGVPIVSPAMSILDLLLKMREESRHMVLVVDEYGGIDGLVTIGDIIESIIGEIDDEHDTEEEPRMVRQPDDTLVADSRVDIEEFEEEYGEVFTEEEREESDTLGGIVCFLAGRVPARGEILTHSSGIVFEVLDADPKRIQTLKIRNIPGNHP